MPKNFFNRIKKSMTSLPKENIPMVDKERDFERAKDVLFSSKNLEQLVSAIKYINNFNKKYRIHEKSPEFIYFGRMIKLMKQKLRSTRFKIDDELSEGERLSPRIKNIIRESLGDLSWIEDTQSNFDPKFTFNGKEQWVDVSQLNRDERKKLVDYINEVLPDREDWEADGLGDIRRGNRKAIIIHCGSERTDYEPEENLLCFADKNYEEDYNLPELDINNSIYIDGREVIEYINMMYGDEELDESLEWTDKDGSFDEKDKSFENDPDWKNDESWISNPERSYWKQGDAGGSAGGGMNEEDGDFDWLEDTKEHANYKGHPQGIVLLRDHQEIDRFCDIIDEYNGEVVDNARDSLHTGLEDGRDELESMSTEDGEDYGEAVLSVSFFVEKRHPGKLTLGYWPYDVTEDEWAIKDWLDRNYTFNRDYEIYNNLNQVEGIFKNYQNPELD